VIVTDSSAIIAILEEESQGAEFLSCLSQAERVALSALSLFECDMILFYRRGEVGLEDMRKLLSNIDAHIFPFDEMAAAHALEAFKLYGKGLNPKSRLNLCDCASYALAKHLDAPLLFKGGDFAETDVKRCFG